jgi:hypothetical protein
MPIVHGIEFHANQAELVKDLIRELLKDGNCVVYALPNMKPEGELRMAMTSPKITKIAQADLLRTVRIWRKEVPNELVLVKKETLTLA